MRLVRFRKPAHVVHLVHGLEARVEPSERGVAQGDNLLLVAGAEFAEAYPVISDAHGRRDFFWPRALSLAV